MPKAAASAGVKRAAAKREREAALPDDQVIEAMESGWTEGMDQTYELVDVDTIKEHPDNYNQGDEVAIRESMDENGWFGAVLVQRSTGFIIAHNHSYRVAKQKGALQVPVIWKDVDDVEALRILVSDNETAKRAVRDNDRLTQIVETLGTVKGTGLDLDWLEAADGAREDAEAAEEAKKGAGKGDGDEEDDGIPTQYGVVVICEDEEDQERIYKQLTEEGWTVRPVSV